MLTKANPVKNRQTPNNNDKSTAFRRESEENQCPSGLLPVDFWPLWLDF
ncbi:gp23 [Roseibium sp. TrichSKD4]|nr:gp23 [Roseibium sp. TrichSKD4]